VIIEPSRVTSLVFVCEHGAAKSMIAATLFNREATRRELTVRAVSRGTLPDTEVPLLVRDGLRAEGIELGSIHPKGLDAPDATGRTFYVTFDVDLPPSFASVENVRRWDALPSVMETFPQAREAIATRVNDLIDDLERPTP